MAVNLLPWDVKPRQQANTHLAVFTDLIADHAAYGSATHGTQYAATCNDRTCNATQACAGNCTFLTMAHVVP